VALANEALILAPMGEDQIAPAAAVWWRSSVSVSTGPDHPELLAFETRLALEPWSVTLALSGGEIIGLMAIQAPDAWLRQLFIDPPHQGRGVGDTLLREAMRQMPAGFFLNTHVDNARARAFYEARGLRLTGVEPHPTYGNLQARYAWSPAGPA
jgi:ribosomal protein S18 acetylase RimI-like enzyme